jgi:gamma-glutamyltranspeptidase/glutathione hydrolase
MTMEDLVNYKVVIRQPLHITYRGYNIYSCPAPSSGTIALSILKIVEGFPGSDKKILDLKTHRVNEAVRHGFGARAELGDPSYSAGMKDRESYLLSEKRAASIRAEILDHTTRRFADYNPKGLEITESGGTSHIVAADSTGLSISLTSTVNKNFGSRIVVPATGRAPTYRPFPHPRS